MRVVIQRVSKASVQVNGEIVGSISKGLLVFLGITHDDDMEDVSWLVKKMIRLRIFNDTNDVMNLSLLDINGELLVVSQFTLHALTKKGNRPSYIDAAKPDTALPLYKSFVEECEKVLGRSVSTGVFGAMMDVQICNDGPVTILMDSKCK
ncbi:D-aminoacyl-tRNA deacylase [Flavobacteriaceae bacterium]|nr:D-aminoacyl-tRNA deacylase [Flavobacteriaceae bacterium]